MGALGRCGRGAKKCAAAVGLPTIEWDMAETKVGKWRPAPGYLPSLILPSSTRRHGYDVGCEIGLGLTVLKVLGVREIMVHVLVEFH